MAKTSEASPLAPEPNPLPMPALIPGLNHAQLELLDGYIEQSIDALHDLYGAKRSHYVVGELGLAISPETTDGTFKKRMEIINNSTGSKENTAFANQEAVKVLTRLYQLTHGGEQAFFEMRFDSLGDLTLLKEAIPKETMEEFRNSPSPRLTWALAFNADSHIPALEERKSQFIEKWSYETRDYIVSKIKEYIRQNRSSALRLSEEKSSGLGM